MAGGSPPLQPAGGPTVTGPSPRAGQKRRPLTIALCVLATAATAFALVLAGMRATVLDRSGYAHAFEQARAYDRLYSEVLPDQASAPVTADLLARLPVDPTLVTANLKVVLPPATVRGMVSAQLDAWMAYLSGRQSHLYLTLDLRPIFDNVADLANTYVGRAIASRPTYQAGSIQEATRAVLRIVGDLGAGRLPARLPSIQLSPAEVEQLTSAVRSRAPGLDQQTVAQLRTDLVTGDLAGALTVLGPQLLGGLSAATADLSARLDHTTAADLEVPLAVVRTPALGDAGMLVHTLAPVLWWLFGASLALAALAFGLAARMARWSPAAAARRGCVGVLAAAAITLVFAVYLHAVGAHALSNVSRHPSQLGPAARRLIEDVGTSYLTDMQRRVLLLMLGVALTAAAVLVSLAARPAIARAWQAGRRARWSTAFVGALPAALLLTASLTAAGAAPRETLRCNGHASLCDRPYSAVTYLTAHNAMATSEDRFLGPAQDPSMVHQLDNGVRALMIDTHYWTTPPQVEAFLATLTPSTRAVLAPIARVATYQRPGIWLCHDICQLGATPVTQQLREIRDWVQRNPYEVITLIFEDHISAADTLQAMAASGLDRYTATPPRRPQDPWPTLGEMVRSGHRVVALTERQDSPGTYLRNLFHYASDTPFAVHQPAALACRPNRGDPSAPMLILNDWVNRAASSRREAMVTNSARFIVQRAALCTAAGRPQPTFVAVDFATIGDALAGVDQLNGVPDD